MILGKNIMSMVFDEPYSLSIPMRTRRKLTFINNERRSNKSY